MKSFLIAFSLTAMIIACSPTGIPVKEYENHEKQDGTTALSYSLPLLNATSGTVLMQKQGGVTVTASVENFQTKVSYQSDTTVFECDNNYQDKFQVKTTPSVSVSPQRVDFKIKVTNDMERILKIKEAMFEIIYDGVGYSIPDSVLDDYQSINIAPGHDHEIIIKGPSTLKLKNESTISFLIYDMPIKMNKASIIEERGNYEWNFIYSKHEVSKDYDVGYTYYYKEINTIACSKCGGDGKINNEVTCAYCLGTTKVGGAPCTLCGADGKTDVDCYECGERGIVDVPLSPRAPSTIYYSWFFKLQTIPAGAKVRVYNIYSKQYVVAPPDASGFFEWTKTSSVNPKPVLIIENNDTLKLLPIKSTGKASGKVIIDYSSGTPIVKNGTVVE